MAETEKTIPQLKEELRQLELECHKLAGGGLASAVVGNRYAQLDQTDNSEIRDGYQLRFIGKNYAKLQAGLKTETLLVPAGHWAASSEKCIVGSEQQLITNHSPLTTKNVFIAGDNLDALKHLENAYTGKVDVIYIDPPYNTGSDGFVYADNFKFTDEELQEKLGLTATELARVRALTGKSSHSAWLTFMYPRLVIAKRLLKDTGVIFVSIDDNEQANLKLLMDEVFCETNFVAKFDWRKKTGANDAKDIAVITESILLYAKNHLKTIESNLWKRDEDSINKNRYKYADEFVESRGKFYFDTLDRGGLQYSDSMNFGIEAPDGGMIFPNGRSTFENDGWIWKWGKEKVKWGLENKFLEFVKSDKSQDSKFTIKYKVYQNVDNEGNLRETIGRAFLNLITEPINQQGNADFSSLFEGKVYFSNPKPVGLIQYLLKTVDSNSALILDFFAGSGTTADAVMQLNAEDGGSRRWILCTLDEPCNPTSEAANAGYTTID
jgi:adenine specific DNA methylase Mod